ncbi:MAG: menaquinone biosynthesis decarboxylase [Candidatus Thermoplasmatota archaeon]|jgi:4-hydroxy-3-polyprenylbenzoate decarboxylase|nr:menaquinone biosynthesis decarboxylase [Candidatus Thermoplasmatota archaeon]MCL5681105.1 menaquinone biosynthesis decarboxylase [Candidatus Thermoplasmatota archaeon]
MPFEDLHDYLDFLTKKKDLLVIDDPVDPEIELTYVLSEEQKLGKGRTVLFNNVRGSFVPAVGNLFATGAKMEAILGATPSEIGNRLQNLVKIAQGGESFLSKGFELMRELSGVRPKISSSLPSNYETLSGVDLGRYPICKTWPDDGGRFITLPLVVTKDPITGERNAGMYRMQVYDSETTGMHWHIHKGGAEHFSGHGKKEKMEAAVVIGADPLTMFSSVAPIPNGLDEFSFTGLISKSRLDLVKGQTVDIEYPKNFEIVLEGFIDPQETRVEGPFGDHTGYYSLQEEFPVFHIKRVIERRNRIYPTTIVGKLWHEDVILGKAIERIFLPLIQTQIPEIVDMNTMEEAVFHNMVVVSIRKRYPGHAKKVMFALWGMGQLMFSKIVVVVDDDIDVHDRKQVIWAMTTRIDPQEDVLIIPGTVTDTLDHPSRILNYGSKMGIDATRKGKSEGYNRVWPEVLEIPEELRKAMDSRWRKFWL